MALVVVAVSSASSDLSAAVKEAASQATKIVSDDKAATRAAVSAVAEVKSKASALSAITSSSNVLKSIEKTAKAAAEAVSAKDKAVDTSNSKQAEPDADSAKDAAAANSSAAEVAGADVQDEEREAPEAVEHVGVSPKYCALAVMLFLGIACFAGYQRYKEATYLSPYKIAAASAYTLPITSTREGFLEMMS